jgi:hypothetical protein
MDVKTCPGKFLNAVTEDYSVTFPWIEQPKAFYGDVCTFVEKQH